MVDREPRPGRFLLTGSARLLGLRTLPDELPGRSETVDLWPFPQGEIGGEPDGFVDAAFARGSDLPTGPSRLRRGDYIARVEAGGYPEALRRETPRRHDRFFASYLSDLIARDVKQVAEIERADDMRRLLSLLGAQASGLLNANRLASELSVTAPTVRNYLEILETVYLIRRLPAWSSSATTRAVGRPKLISLTLG